MARKRLADRVLFIILTVLALLFLFPILLVFMNSLDRKSVV